MSGQVADQKYQHEADPLGLAVRDRKGKESGCSCTCQGSHRIDVAHKDIGFLGSEDIPDDTSSHACDYTQEDHQVGVGVIGGGEPAPREDPVNGEGGKAKRVRYEKELLVGGGELCLFLRGGEVLVPSDPQYDQKDADSRNKGQDHVGRIPEDHRRNGTDGQIPDKASAGGGDKGKDHDSKQIHFLFNGDHGAGYGEGNGADIIHDIYDFK